MRESKRDRSARERAQDDGAQAAKRKRAKRDELAAEKAAAAYAAAKQACRPVRFRMRIVGGVVRCCVTTSIDLTCLDLDHYLARKCRGGRPRNDGTLSGVAVGGAYDIMRMRMA